MKIKNKRGPSTEPLGTPLLTYNQVDLFLPHITDCLRLVKYDLIHFTESYEKPRESNLFISWLCDTLSKALLKSNRTKIVNNSLLIPDLISSVSLVKVVSVL